MTDPVTDAQIVAESLRHPEAFSRLFDRHHDRIHAFASRRLGADAAADVASETFLVAFRRRGSYDTSYSDAAPWLYGIAVRVALAHWRSERRLLRAPEVHEPPDDDPHAVVDGRLTSAERRTLRHALAGLRRADRDALTLYALAGLSYEEVAQALGVAPGTVASRISRARARLAAQLPGRHPAPGTTT
ncbi:MAG: sigma-70 family RNA polymerase sigma factor, partial [Actinomycetota bacterium]